MKKFTLSVVALLSMISLVAENIPATVNANVLNVRIKPNTSCDVVAKLGLGDKVEVVKVDGEWAQIVTPASANVFVFSKLVVDGKNVKEANLRCGAGTNYQSYGIIPANTQLRIVKEENNGWTKIEPLSTMSSFVHAKFLNMGKNVAANDNKKAPENKDTTKVTPPVVNPNEGKQTLTMSDDYLKLFEPLKNVFVDGSEAEFVISGKLIKSNTPKDHPIHYGINDKTNNRVYLIAAELPEYYNEQKVTIKGKTYSVRNWSNPVLVAEEIEIIK